MIKQFILLMLILAAPSLADDGLKVADLDSVKCDKDALRQLVGELRDEEFGKVSSLLIAKGDTLLLEQYFGDANADKLHPARSHTKSVTSYAVGKAIEQGKIRSVDDPILKYLPEVDASKVLPGVEKITIKDCLTMSAGLRGSKQNRQPKGLKKDAVVPGILEDWTEERVTEKRRFSYSYSDPIIISHVLFNATGETIEEMAAEHFFQPMGIKNYKFRTFGNGLTNPIDSMELRSRDLLKLGLLTLNGGVWKGKQLLNRAYIDAATSPHAIVNKSESYGYFWWINRINVKGKPYEVKTAFGVGGQMIYVIPDFDMVVVFTAEKADKRKLLPLLQDTIVPAFVIDGRSESSRAKAAEAPAQDKILTFGVNGKRNMLYDARQRPQSVLLHGRLYIVYNADATPTKNKKGKAYPMLITYDPRTRRFTEPVHIGPQHSDHHYSPIIWADESDYLHVLHGCYRTPGKHLISAKPVVAGTSKVKWKEAPQIAPKMSYPTAYRVYDEKEVIAYRTNGHTSSWTYRISEDNGKTWVGPKHDVIDLDSKGRTDWSSYRTALPSKDGRYLHMVYVDYDDYITDLTPNRLYNPRYDRVVSNDWKYNLSYVRVDLKSYEVTNIDGKVLRTLIDADYSRDNCLIWDTDGRGAGIPPVIALDAVGDPTFLHVLSEGDLKTHGYYYVRREGSKWIRTRIHSSNHNWNGGYMVHGADGTIHAYLITGEAYLEGGYMDGRGGGTVEEWTSENKGRTWSKKRDLTPDRAQYPGWRFNHVQPVVRPDGTRVAGMLLFYGWKDPDAPTAKAFLLDEGITGKKN